MGAVVKLNIAARVSDGLNAAIAEALASIQALDRGSEVANRLFSALDAPAQLVRFKSDLHPASGAGACVVLLEPSDSFLELLAALRAGNV